MFNSRKIFITFSILIFAFFSTFQTSWGAWAGPTFSPTGLSPSEGQLPITATSDGQFMSGGFAVGDLGTSDTLNLRIINDNISSVSSRLYVSGKVGVGGGAVSAIDPSSDVVLDVDGRIRVRGDNFNLPAAGKALTTYGEGRTRWTDLLTVNNFVAGFGILLSTTTQSVTVSYNPTVLQSRVTGTCPTGAIASINQNGSVVCRSFVNSITTLSGSGLSGGQTSGTSTLTVNVGGGLINNNGLIQVNIPSLGFPSGLMLAGGNLKFDTLSGPCSSLKNMLRWSSVAGGWVCDQPYPASSGSKPGNSILILKKRSSSGTAPACPTGWNDTGVPTTEYADTNSSNTHSVRTCYRSDQACQVMYLRSRSTVPNCPPSPWVDISASAPIAPVIEYAGANGQTNNGRICVKCNP